jgi:K+:H+ antiporter
MRPTSELSSSFSKSLLLYLVVLFGFGAGIWFILAAGSHLNPDRSVVEKPVDSPGASLTSQTADNPQSNRSYLGRIVNQNLRGSLSILLLQIITIIIAARLTGALFLKIGQPPVMGEMVAGILLGPSVVGQLSPATIAFLFPASSMAPLQLFSQLGVILFMFIVGMELNARHLRDNAHAAVMVSHGSIIVPFFLGTALSLIIYRPLASADTSFLAFGLFMGIAMSITAFPVLARILDERGMTKSHLGSTALACAAVDDVTAWCILAVVIAIVQAEGIAASMLTIGSVLLFIVVMILVLKPRLGWMIKENNDWEARGSGLIAGILAFVLACAWFTEVIGIHALFGAFLAGVVMPPAAGFRLFLKEKIETFSLSCLLPLFFAFTGLRTQINLLNDWHSWLLCIVIVGVAVAGKLGGSMMMARWTGMSWLDSFSIGVLMNTRGLMELVVLNIGYDLGILPPRIFSIMVLMALATTSMAGPLLSWVKFRQRNEAVLTQQIPSVG